LARRIKDKNSEYRIVRKLLEPAAYNEDQHSEPKEETLAKKLASYGLNYLPATKSRTMSDKKIEDALTYQKVNLNDREEFIKSPELYIFDTCKHTIYEFEHYRWDEWLGKMAERKDRKEKTVDKDDHFIENIGRILIQNPVFIPMPKRSQNVNERKSYDPFDKPA